MSYQNLSKFKSYYLPPIYIILFTGAYIIMEKHLNQNVSKSYTNINRLRGGGCPLFEHLSPMMNMSFPFMNGFECRPMIMCMPSPQAFSPFSYQCSPGPIMLFDWFGTAGDKTHSAVSSAISSPRTSSRTTPPTASPTFSSEKSSSPYTASSSGQSSAMYSYKDPASALTQKYNSRTESSPPGFAIGSYSPASSDQSSSYFQPPTAVSPPQPISLASADQSSSYMQPVGMRPKSPSSNGSQVSPPQQSSQAVSVGSPSNFTEVSTQVTTLTVTPESIPVHVQNNETSSRPPQRNTLNARTLSAQLPSDSSKSSPQFQSSFKPSQPQPQGKKILVDEIPSYSSPGKPPFHSTTNCHRKCFNRCPKGFQCRDQSQTPDSQFVDLNTGSSYSGDFVPTHKSHLKSGSPQFAADSKQRQVSPSKTKRITNSPQSVCKRSSGGRPSQRKKLFVDEIPSFRSPGKPQFHSTRDNYRIVFDDAPEESQFKSVQQPKQSQVQAGSPQFVSLIMGSSASSSSNSTRTHLSPLKIISDSSENKDKLKIFSNITENISESEKQDLSIIKDVKNFQIQRRMEITHIPLNRSSINSSVKLNMQNNKETVNTPGQRIIIPKGMVSPDETTIIEIPFCYKKLPIIIAQKNGQETRDKENADDSFDENTRNQMSFYKQ